MPCWKSCVSKPRDPPSVEELDFRQSNLIAVPPEVFEHERTLEKLSLASNQITALPPSLFHCHELRELELYDNEIQSIPAAIGTLTRLTKLDVSRNAITEVADTIKNCKALSHLNLSLNHLVKVPEGVSQLVGLEELNLTDTCLEYLSANFGRLTKLRMLELRENLLQSLPKSMTRFSHLTRLDIGHNEMREVPEIISTMTSLTELYVDNNSILTIPKFIGNLTKLLSLDCSNNDIYEVADELCKCTHLTDLNFSFNTLSCLPDGLGMLECITILRIDNNIIQYLPEKFGHLKNLHEFSAMKNSLKALPPSFGLLRKLQTLLLDENLLTELPKEIGSCTQLSILHVTRNQLTSIPSEIGYLSNLKVLSISGNLIQNLPVSILNIPKLGAIWISDSQSKPLLPLNKETLTTGQVVLTCFLLPQLCVNNEARTLFVEEKEHEIHVTRPRQPTIKFADSVNEGTNGDNVEEEPMLVPISSNTKPPGLSRAPTPYPKELRALAKHASQIHTRHSREQNGDVMAMKESRSFEGDVEFEQNLASYSVAGVRCQKSNGEGMPVNHDVESGESERLLYPGGRGYEKGSSLQYDSVRRMRMGQGQGITGGPETVQLTNGVGTTVRPEEQALPWTSYLSQPPDTSSKTPPPYHIAARRAAFFRNSATPSIATSSNSSPISPSILSPSADSAPSTFAFNGSPNAKLPLSPSIELTQITAPSKFQLHDAMHSTPSNNNGTMEEVNSSKMEPIGLNETFTKDGSTNSILLNSTFTVDNQRKAGPQDNIRPEPPPITRNDYTPPSSARISAPPMEGESSIPKFTNNYGSDTDTGIFETVIPTEWKRYDTPAGLSSGDELEGGTDSSDGPPILPMRPIVRDYSQLSTMTVANSQIPRHHSAGDSSRICLSSRRIVPDTPSPKTFDPLSYSQSNTSGNVGMAKFMTVGGSGGHDSTDSGRSQHQITAIPVGSPPQRSFESGAVTSSFPKQQTATGIPTYRSSFGKSNSSNINHYQTKTPDSHPQPSGIPSLKGGAKLTHSESSLPNTTTSMVRRNSSGRQPIATPDGQTAQNGSVDRGHSVSASRIPVMNKKPWIFGTHRNNRVVSFEYRKVNDLGFTISHSGAPNDKGAYVHSIDDPDSSVRVGDKILEVDNIDVSKMSLDIVRKILSNCQETMSILVSREN